MVKFGHTLLEHSARHRDAIDEGLYVDYKSLKKAIKRRDETGFWDLFEREMRRSGKQSYG